MNIPYPAHLGDFRANSPFQALLRGRQGHPLAPGGEGMGWRGLNRCARPDLDAHEPTLARRGGSASFPILHRTSVGAGAPISYRVGRLAPRYIPLGARLDMHAASNRKAL